MADPRPSPERPRPRRQADDPALAELFGGVDRCRAFRLLFADPERAFRARELAALAGIDPGNTSRWLRRWTEAGLLQAVVRDGHRAWRVAPDPRLAALRQVVVAAPARAPTEADADA
jgi:hypothetical protein